MTVTVTSSSIKSILRDKSGDGGRAGGGISPTSARSTRQQRERSSEQTRCCVFEKARPAEDPGLALQQPKNKRNLSISLTLTTLSPARTGEVCGVLSGYVGGVGGLLLKKIGLN